MGFLTVFMGAGLGGALRHGFNLLVLRLGWTAFPGGTLAINVVGSFLMGLLTAFFTFRAHLLPQWRLFLATGVLGGFTTFSTFSLDAVLLYQRGRVVLAALYVFASVAFSIAALFAALAIARPLFRT